MSEPKRIPRQEGKILADVLIKGRQEVTFLRRQEQLWGHFFKNLTRSIQLDTESLNSIIVDNLKFIVANLLEIGELSKDDTFHHLAKSLETIQIDLFELDDICHSLSIKSENHNPLTSDYV